MYSKGNCLINSIVNKLQMDIWFLQPDILYILYIIYYVLLFIIYYILYTYINDANIMNMILINSNNIMYKG